MNITPINTINNLLTILPTKTVIKGNWVLSKRGRDKDALFPQVYSQLKIP